MLGSWSVFSLAELLVLYSRLHLVIQSPKVQRWVLIVIISTIFTFQIPTWVVVWPAWDIDPKVSSLWSPRDGIVERYTQLGFSIVESFISGIYIYSLVKLLQLKNSVRQRRVMIDLIYVNVIVVAFDLLMIILVYLNQVGLSHPVQVFSYTLKLRLEFVVLNQLMAVAARGLKRRTFADKRYHHSSPEDGFSAELKDWDGTDGPSTGHGIQTRHVPNKDNELKGSTQISVPSPVLSKGQKPSNGQDKEWSPDPGEKVLPLPPLDGHSSCESIEQPESLGPDDESSQPRSRRIERAVRSVRPQYRHNREGSDERPISQQGQKQHKGRRQDRVNEDDDEDGEIELHMWENRGRIILEVPWFRNTHHDN